MTGYDNQAVVRPQDLQGDQGLVMSFWATVTRVPEDYKRTTKDGKPYITVFLNHTSFVWTGQPADPIEVERGEHGEPVEYLIAIPPEHPLVGGYDVSSQTPTQTTLAFFMAVCVEFQRAQEGE